MTPRARAVLIGAACLACGSEPLSGRPDVLLVVLDTVRADHLSAYGYARPTAPHLEELARRGVLFEDVVAPANWTWPTHASLFTGAPPWIHGAHFGRGEADVHFDWGGFARPMRRDLPTLAERLGAAGYRSAFLTANPVLQAPLADSITRGFEQRWDFATDRRALDQARAVLLSRDPRPLFLFVNLFGAHNPYEARAVPWPGPESADRLAPGAAPAWLRPFLATGLRGVDLQKRLEPGGPSLSLRIASGELAPPPPLLELLRDLYDGELLAVDAVLGELLEAWWRRAPRDAIVAVTSDHGEYLGEHGLVEHTYLLYSQVLQVPLVLCAPGRLPEGVRVATPVQLQDLHATLLDLALGEPHAASLRPLALGQHAAAPRPALRAIAYPRTDSGIEKLRLVHRYYREGDDVLLLRSDGTAELYDLAADPAMTGDLAPAQRERVAILAARAATAFEEGPGAPQEPIRIPDESRERLRELGYAE
jgi:arylsulfatase A-like enzyme